jgi:transcriptional regulator with XRE-family HTH domain
VKFAENIVFLREHYKLNRTELAEMIGVDRVMTWKYETRRSIPTADTLLKIADAFHVSTDWLLGRDTSKDGQTPDIMGAQERKRLFNIEKFKKELAELEGRKDR